MTPNSATPFRLSVGMFDKLEARFLLEQAPVGWDDGQLRRLDWHIRNAALAVSGTSQLASFNGLVDFVAAHYAQLLGVPHGDDLNDLTVKFGFKKGLGAIRQADSVQSLQVAYQVLLTDIAAFLNGAVEEKQNKPTAAQTARRAAIANAIWLVRREDEDRCDQDLDDLPVTHSVWQEADAVLAVLASEAAEQ